MAVIGALTEKLERAPMDLDRLLASSSSSTTGDFPFKLVVCLPLARCLHSFKAQQTVSHVRSKLGCQLEDAQVESITSDSAFCVTVVQGGDFSSEGCDHMGRPWLLSGTSALLLVATDGEPKDQLEMRLAETLRDALRLQPAPCVCLLDLGDQAVIENVDLRGLLPPVWRMFSCSREVPPRTVLEEAVHWCSQSRAVPPSLRTSLLRDFIAEAFYRLVYDTIYRDLAQHSMHWQFPNHMIKMINCTLDHLAAVAASEQLLGLSVVAPEMKHSSYSPDWNEPQHLEALSKHVKSLKLAEVCGDTRDVDTLVNYVEQLCSKHRHLGCPKAAVLGSVSTTLKRHGEDDAQLSSTLPWFDILQECFCHLLIEFCFKGEELVVHYLPAELDQFNAWDTWVDITLGTTDCEPTPRDCDDEAELDPELWNELTEKLPVDAAVTFEDYMDSDCAAAMSAELTCEEIVSQVREQDCCSSDEDDTGDTEAGTTEETISISDVVVFLEKTRSYLGCCKDVPDNILKKVADMEAYMHQRLLSARQKKITDCRENQTPVAGKVDSEYVCQLEQMVAHQRSLSASLTSQLETMLPTPSNVSTPEQGEDKTALGGKVDSECMRQLELMVARQKSLSASFTSQLESMLTTPSDVAMPEQG
ncbi:hypothetical protein HPB52_003449 [Rhipicephalus sanguineus]|uniref:Germinal-centre associated nuclear protein MCM3AP domain-containing protein n=1 Tax=Rhipicephalus sanguineus TaxID=34632 RepID=A0A9D4PL64_RHISA|nr:hypothetical protein HPB52_003449 [Rhipicephalus sanguineus]